MPKAHERLPLLQDLMDFTEPGQGRTEGAQRPTRSLALRASMPSLHVMARPGAPRVHWCHEIGVDSRIEPRSMSRNPPDAWGRPSLRNRGSRAVGRAAIAERTGSISSEGVVDKRCGRRCSRS